jgi:hypothetical protein
MENQKWEYRVLRGILVGVLVVSLSACFASTIEKGGEKYGSCDPLPCLSLSIAEIPEQWFDPLPKSASEKIRSEISALLFSGSTGDGSKDSSVNTYEGLKEELVARFQDEFGSGATTSTLWFVEKELQKVFENEMVITIAVSSRGYLGGVHDFEERSFVSFEKGTGDRITLENLVAPYSRQILSSISAIEFRRAYSIPVGQSLEESGFLIKNTVDFPISENIGIVEAGLMVHFNPYEIAPFSKGSFSFVLPFDALEPILRSDGVADGKIRSFFKAS